MSEPLPGYCVFIGCGLKKHRYLEKKKKKKRRRKKKKKKKKKKEEEEEERRKGKNSQTSIGDVLWDPLTR